jgi:hypothetical protein
MIILTLSIQLELRLGISENALNMYKQLTEDMHLRARIIFSLEQAVEDNVIKSFRANKVRLITHEIETNESLYPALFNTIVNDLFRTKFLKKSDFFFQKTLMQLLDEYMRVISKQFIAPYAFDGVNNFEVANFREVNKLIGTAVVRLFFFIFCLEILFSIDSKDKVLLAILEKDLKQDNINFNQFFGSISQPVHLVNYTVEQLKKFKNSNKNKILFKGLSPSLASIINNFETAATKFGHVLDFFFRCTSGSDEVDLTVLRIGNDVKVFFTNIIFDKEVYYKNIDGKPRTRSKITLLENLDVKLLTHDMSSKFSAIPLQLPRDRLTSNVMNYFTKLEIKNCSSKLSGVAFSPSLAMFSISKQNLQLIFISNPEVMVAKIANFDLSGSEQYKKTFLLTFFLYVSLGLKKNILQFNFSTLEFITPLQFDYRSRFYVNSVVNFHFNKFARPFLTSGAVYIPDSQIGLVELLYLNAIFSLGTFSLTSDLSLFSRAYKAYKFLGANHALSSCNAKLCNYKTLWFSFIERELASLSPFNVSTTGISLDATASGLQHIAMLMGDSVLAQDTNLLDQSSSSFVSVVIRDVYKKYGNFAAADASNKLKSIDITVSKLLSFKADNEFILSLRSTESFHYEEESLVSGPSGISTCLSELEKKTFLLKHRLIIDYLAYFILAEKILSRKIFKSVVMPYSYGKKKQSMVVDLIRELQQSCNADFSKLCIMGVDINFVKID